MSIFDSEFDESKIGGTPISPEEIGAELEAKGYVSWAVVARWCEEHPGVGRRFEGIYAGVTTKLRKRFPHLTIKTERHRFRPNSTSKGQICDLTVVYVPPDGESPFEFVSGRTEDEPQFPERLRERGRFVSRDAAGT